MKRRIFGCAASCLFLGFTGMTVWGCSGEVVKQDIEMAENDEGEGPWVGGVFEHRDPANTSETNSGAIDVEDAPLVAANGDTNEVVVMLKREGDAFHSALGGAVSSASSKGPEDALVDAIRQQEPHALARFGSPLGARYLISSLRLSDEGRMQADADSPEDRLHRYVILRFESIDQARSAAVLIGKLSGVEYVSLGQALAFSASPNDPYFPVKSVAAFYQWGMHAMGFPAAWDLTPGSGWVGAADAGALVQDDLGNLRSQLSFDTVSLPASYKIHGTHVSGILAATQNNTKGVTGGCPSCSLAMAACAPMNTGIPAAITGLVDRGIQVINMSFGKNGYTCQTTGMQPICDAIAYAQSRDVLMVAAAGNFNNSAPDFPANQPAVLAVGGIENTNPSQPSQWQSWWYNSANGSTAAGISGVVAPAKSIVSTVPISGAYNPNLWVMCGDAAGYDESGTPSDGYGSCTGTSMASPHVAALGGLVRSVNPRLSVDSVRNIIRQNSSHKSAPTAKLGYGLPNTYSAVSQAISVTPNRLTPLFAFYSAGRLDYFYTTVPQMASTAITGLLQPGVGTSPPGYTTIGVGVGGYSSFPGIAATLDRTPRAQVWIFTTPANPKSSAIPLEPLYRLSWKCGDPGNSPVCASNPNHTDFVYTADQTGVSTLSSWGYKLDGIEGYIYPKTISQPPGTVRLMRKYNSARDDHAIFPETELAKMQAEGYTTNSGSDWLGYVYSNTTGAVPPIQ